MSFIYALPGAVAEGLIWGLMAIGVYISYKILDIADLTVDGSICTGACVCAVMLGVGAPVWLCIILAFIAGAIAGVLTGLFHTALGIPSILAGILTQLILYSVNLCILGGKSLAAIDPRANHLLVHMSNNPKAILSMGIIVVVTIVGLQLGGLISGAVVTERIFALPGFGKLTLDAVFTRDYPVIQAYVLWVALIYMVINLIVDISYNYIDPRMRLKG